MNERELLRLRIEKIPRDLLQLAVHDPLVNACMRPYVDGNATLEDCLVHCVRCLGERSKEQQRNLNDLYAKLPTVLVVDQNPGHLICCDRMTEENELAVWRDLALPEPDVIVG